MKRYDDIVDELEAKSWQASRRGKKREDHVCYRAAREIVRLREIADVPAAEKGWRAFWKGFSDFLHLGHEQRTYTWHDLQDACSKGMETVKRDCALANNDGRQRDRLGHLMGTSDDEAHK